MKLDILFRSCDRVDAFTGYPRFLDVPKSEIILRSLNSLLKSANKSLEHQFSITVMDDHSSEYTISKIQEILAKYPRIPSQILIIKGSGNGDSLLSSYNYARSSFSDLIYFCEDDYIHAPTAIEEMLDIYSVVTKIIQNPELVVYPSDYIDRYQQMYQSFIFLGKYRHWRTIKHTTGTIMLPTEVLKKYWEQYMGLTHYGKVVGISEDNTINIVYKDVMCLSPMPSLAIHLQYQHTLSPYINWQSWWDNSIY